MEDAVRELEGLLERAREGGARGCEILREASKGVSLTVHRGASRDAQEFVSGTMSVRVWLQGGRSGHAVGGLDGGGALVAEALSQASGAEPDPQAGPVDQLARAARGGLGIDDRRYGGLSMDDRMEVVGDIERSVRNVDARLTASDISWCDSRTRRTYVSSRGARFDEHSTLYEGAVTVAGVVGTERVVATEAVASRSFASLASVPYAANLARVVASVLADGPTLDSGPIRVVLAPTATARLIERLAEGFDSDDLAKGEHFLLVDGAPLPVHPHIHMLDDGQAPGGLRTHGFDDRGVVPRPITLIKEGRVDEGLLGLRASRRLGGDPTGHWFGGRTRPSNVSLRAGTRSINAHTAEIGGTFLLLEHLPDLTEALDLKTGRFDCTVSGVVLQGKHPAGVVRNRRLQGDLGEVLAKVVTLCSNTDRIRHVDAPGIILDGFSLV